MRSLAVSYMGILGGAERLLVDLAAGLPEPPLLACPAGPLADAARARGLGVFELRERSFELRRSVRDRVAAPARIAAQAAELRALVASARPEVLVAWGMRAGLVVATGLRPGRHPPLLFQHNDLLPGPAIALAVRAGAGQADLVTAVSRCVARDLDPGGRLGARLRTVHPGVDLERFAPAASSASDEVLVLGAIEAWKRPELALEAVALAAQRLPSLRVRVAGAPIGTAGEALLERMRRRAEAPDLRGRVVLAGAVERAQDALAAAACLLHCAEREPFGMVLAEALASGTPVVAPDSCGPAEIVTPDCGRLYRPGDAGAAAAALVEVLADAAAYAGTAAAARARAERSFDISAMRAEYAALLGGLAAGTEPARPPAPAAAGRSPVAGTGLAVVTVLHDSEEALAGLLASVEAHLPGARLVVVDSGSSDGGVELARRWRDGAAQVLVLGRNAGFGPAVNAGLALVEEPVAALLNPDVELTDASLATLAKEALRAPERLLVPLVLRPDGSREDNAQREPGDAALLVHALVPGALLPRRLGAAVEPWRSARPSRAGWPVGSAIVARTETLRRLGPFDERAFMYAEDLDLGLRAADAGIETWFWPAARVVHTGAHSSIRVFGGEPYELLARRRREVVRERRGAGRARADDLLQALTLANRMLLKCLSGRDTKRERRRLAALLAAMRR